MFIYFTPFRSKAFLISTCRYFSKTIFAVSSGRGKSGVAVVRVSGPNAQSALQMLTHMKTLPRPRYATLKSINNPCNGEIIDKGIVIWFPGPNSFTGEDSCEFQIHGGNAVITSVLDALGSIKNLRLAEPGEFTKRAFYNGKLDLTEVEGLSDLLAAETEVQRKQAFLQSQGSLTMVYDKWKDMLITCLSHLEAHIDFDETETIDQSIQLRVEETVKTLYKDISAHLKDGRKGERLRNGVRTVILGAPNVGKSSLLNILCRRPAAIVTPIEGTTRDILEIMLDINGYPLILIDTAGLRSHTKDIIEEEGIRRAMDAYKSADLILLVIDCTNYLTWSKQNGCSFKNYLKTYLEGLNLKDLIKDLNEANSCNTLTIPVLNKCDLFDSKSLEILKNLKVPLISCKKENGIALLLEDITNNLKILCGDPSKEHPNMNQMRHRHYLTLCLNSLDKFLVLVNEDMDVVLMAEELRKAVQQMGKITGVITTDQLLDVIFKEFCIGK